MELSFKDIRRDVDLANSALNNFPRDANIEVYKDIMGQLSALIRIVKSTMNLVIDSTEETILSEGKDTLVITYADDLVDTRGRFKETIWKSVYISKEDFDGVLREKEDAKDKRRKRR